MEQRKYQGSPGTTEATQSALDVSLGGFSHYDHHVSYAPRSLLGGFG